VVSAATLKDAQARPEKYPSLMVRVAGYSAYFNDLSREMQNDIISRMEHTRC
jgi:formate C-acetyltransferase